MAEPPSSAGAVQLNPAEALAGVALNDVGAPGVVLGVIVTGWEAVEPFAFVALTVQVYATPVLSPLKVAVKVDGSTVADRTELPSFGVHVTV
jgi:hypothetical protein